MEDALGVTVVLLTCSYRNQEFVRVGYFINNEYTDPEMRENPPAKPQFDKVGFYPSMIYKYCVVLVLIELICCRFIVIFLVLNQELRE